MIYTFSLQNVYGPYIMLVINADPDQTKKMCRLALVSSGHICYKVILYLERLINA